MECQGDLLRVLERIYANVMMPWTLLSLAWTLIFCAFVDCITLPPIHWNASNPMWVPRRQAISWSFGLRFLLFQLSSRKVCHTLPTSFTIHLLKVKLLTLLIHIDTCRIPHLSYHIKLLTIMIITGNTPFHESIFFLDQVSPVYQNSKVWSILQILFAMQIFNHKYASVIWGTLKKVDV